MSSISDTLPPVKNAYTIPCSVCGALRQVSYRTYRYYLDGERTRCFSCGAKARRSHAHSSLKMGKEHIASGATIYWDTMVKVGQMYRFDIQCVCGKIRRVTVERRRDYNSFLTGICPTCNGKRHSGAKHPLWKGGRTIDKSGYVQLHHTLLSVKEQSLFSSMKNHSGYIWEHRLVVARSLCRPLTKSEYVHHLNGIKDDNRLENLKLVGSSEHGAEEKRRFDLLQKEIARLQGLLRQYNIPF